MDIVDFFEPQMEESEQSDLYKQFYHQLWEKYKLKKADIIKWTYAGFFDGDAHKMTDDANKSRSHEYRLQVERGRRLWIDVMGKTPMPYELAVDECVCKVEIRWNHILIEDPKADEIEIIIIGSECIERFIKISMKRKCSVCKEDMKRNIKSGICKTCSDLQKKKCKTDGCQNERVKRKKSCHYCLNPRVYCPCGKNKRNRYKGKYMPQCYECWSMNK